MTFEQFTVGGCQSYLIGCRDICVAVLIDPEISLIGRYLALAALDGGMKAWRKAAYPIT